MRIVGGAEVLVTCPSGQAFKEVLHGNTTYVVAKPGEEFYIKVRLGGIAKHIKPSAGTNCVVIYVKVDGKDVGYSVISYDHTTFVSFKGFLTERHTTKAGEVWSYATFKFAEAKNNEVDTQQVSAVPNAIQTGTIQLEFQPAMARKVPLPAGKRTYSQHLRTETVGAQDKKWFLAPSLQAAKGSAVASTFKTAITTDPVGPRVATLKLQYETASTLQLRGALDPSIEEHQHILELYPAGAPEEADLGSSGAPVKPEIGSFSSGRANAPATVLLDLTKDDLPKLKIGGREMKPDEFAVCDLTSTHTEPAWEVRKRPRVELD